MAKSKYESNVQPKLKLIEAWARDGLTLQQIAKNLGISKQTLHEYQKRFPDFSDALKNGKEVIDIQVENTLLKSAMGFYYTEQAVTNKGEVVDVTRYEKPNITALIFWLKNRRPDVWRDNPAKQDLDKAKFEFDKEQASKQVF